jgi:hypothetical protein
MLPAPMIPIFMSVLRLQVRFRFALQTFDSAEISRHRACGRFFAIPKEINFPVASQKIGFCNPLVLGGTIFVDSPEVSQFLHFRGTRWPFCWDQQLRPTNRSRGLLE